MSIIEIKSLSSPDVDVDLWQPESVQDVCFLLEIEIGEACDERRDLFHVIVATPEGLRMWKCDEESIITDRATIIIAYFTWKNVHNAIENIVRQCTASDWSQSVLRLQRYFRWEYEDYCSGSPRGARQDKPG
jgi:hypothetical protein